MNRPDQPSEEPEHTQAATTAGKGTPLGVRLTSSPQARATIAAFLAGPLIWSVHFMAVYLVTEAGCAGLAPLGPPVPTVFTLAATAAAALACAATAAWAYRRWRTRSAAPVHPDQPEFPYRAGGLDFAGFLLSLLGIVSILIVGLPALVLPACGP